MAGGDYAGTSKLYIQGSTTGSSPDIDLDNPIVRASIFWAPAGTSEPITDISQLSEQPSNGTNLRFPGALNWNLYDDPGESQLATAPSGAKYGLGFLFLYRDYNNNNIYDGTDALVAQDNSRAVLYAPDGLSAADSPSSFAIPPGFHLVTLPFACAGRQHGDPEGDCGVPLGASCTGDADCGSGGTCLVTQPFPFPGGDCVLVSSGPGGCMPKGGILYRYLSGTPQVLNAIWVPACDDPSQCTRGEPYQCDFGQGACMPTGVNQMTAESTVPMPQVCAPAP